MNKKLEDGLGNIPGFLWRTAVSPVTFVVLSILWCVDLGAGSIVAYFNDSQFWVKMDSYPFSLWMSQVAPGIFPMSLWIYVLVVLSYLMILSLLMCTVNWFIRRRRRIRGLGEVLVHLGFLLVFTGFVIGSAWGVRARVHISEGEKVKVPGMGMALRLDNLKVIQSPQGRPLDTHSRVSLFASGSKVSQGSLRLNHPFIYGNTVVYPPEDYGTGVIGGVLGTQASGAVRLVLGRPVTLGRDRVLELGGVLQRGERRGNAIGPGLLVLVKNFEGKVMGSAYLSPAPGMNDRAVVAGNGIVLGQLSESVYGVFRVNRDPGVWFVIVGAVILSVGTIWALAGYLGILPSGAGPTS